METRETKIAVSQAYRAFPAIRFPETRFSLSLRERIWKLRREARSPSSGAPARPERRKNPNALRSDTHIHTNANPARDVAGNEFELAAAVERVRQNPEVGAVIAIDKLSVMTDSFATATFLWLTEQLADPRLAPPLRAEHRAVQSPITKILLQCPRTLAALVQ